MAELQTVAAVLEVSKFAYEIARWLKKVKDAHQIAADLETRIKRLYDVLKGIQTVLKYREGRDIATEASDAQVAARIHETVGSCMRTLKDLQDKLGGFGSGEQNVAKDVWRRVQVACQQPSINRISAELEACIQILTTDLTVLHLFEQIRTGANITSNHDEVLGALSTLGDQVTQATNVLNKLIRAHRDITALDDRRISATSGLDEALQDVSQEAIERLTECLRDAEDVRKTFTSEYIPDDRSIFQHRCFDSPLPADTPVSRRCSLHSVAPDVVPIPPEVRMNAKLPAMDVVDEDEEVMPLKILDRYIAGYIERASKEQGSDHHNQAEVNLNQAIQYSLKRESRYGISFDNRADLEEELAMVYLKQKKWGEAVMKVTTLLRERTGSSAASGADDQNALRRARQNQLLASIYFERHMSSTTAPLSITTEDIENADRHAHRAFNNRWEIRERGPLPDEEEHRYQDGTRLLIRILEARDKTVEANELSFLLSEGPSMPEGNNRRPSSACTRPEEDAIVEVDKHDILVEAIKNRDMERISEFLTSKGLDLERLSKEKKTFLMHAVEKSDESVVHKLLDPEVGAEVNTVNKSGLTALHVAVMGGHHDMIQCLLKHDADVGLRDSKYDTPIIKAVRAGDQEAVRILFDHDEATVEVKGQNEWSLLHFAVAYSQPRMADLLLDLQPELRYAVDQVGQTALHHCAEKDKYDQAAVLLRHRNHPDVNAVDSINRTALSLVGSKVARPEREDFVRLLLDHDADVRIGRAPGRGKDYEALRRQRRDSTLSRTSVSTSGTIGTASTSTSRLSRVVGRFGRG